MRVRMAFALLVAALAALVSLPFSALAGRPLGWGTRVRERMWDRARAAREARDARIAAALDAEAEQVEAVENETLPEATAPSRSGGADQDAVPAPDGADSSLGGTGMAIFDFRTFAEEMLAAASSAEAEGPGAMMDVLKAFTELPETLGLIARTFDVVVARCDSEFPLDAAVTAEVEATRAQLHQAGAASESIAETFRAKHAVEIARHEDPRTGEGMWDVGGA